MTFIAYMDTTTISISVENYQWLSGLKRPGESFNDVLDKVREGYDSIPPHDTQPDVDELPDDLDLPGSDDVLEERRAAIASMYVYLQTHRTATKSDLLELVDADRVGYSSRESFWANCVKGRESLKALPDTEPPSEGGRTWRYTD
jgi:hypothetical protein